MPAGLQAEVQSGLSRFAFLYFLGSRDRPVEFEEPLPIRPATIVEIPAKRSPWSRCDLLQWRPVFAYCLIPALLPRKEIPRCEIARMPRPAILLIRELRQDCDPMLDGLSSAIAL